MKQSFAIMLSGACVFVWGTRDLHAQSVLFEDVTASAGVDYVQWDGSSGVGLHHPEILRMSAGAAAGDFDGDDYPDLYVTRLNMPNLLFHNLKDGTFEDVAEDAGVDHTGYSTGAAWGDVNNDGLLDLYVLSLDDQNLLYINQGNSEFVEMAVERGAHVPSSSNTHRRHGTAFGDIDLDGDLDLHVVEWASSNSLNRLLLNDGTGYFSDVTSASGVLCSSSWGFSSGFCDLNDDGWPELLIAADFGTSRLFQNLGEGLFQNQTGTAQVGTDENGMGSAIGDIDNDGDMDWFVTSIYDPDESCEAQLCSWGYSGNRLYENQGAILFADATDDAGVHDGGWGWGASFLDFDNDGDLDLGMTNGVIFPWASPDDPFNDDPIKLWENNGSGVMTEVGSTHNFVDTRSGKGFVVFDYDGDGDQDVFIANNAEYPVLFRNNGGNDNDWLQVSFRGAQTNWYGIGARIQVQVLENGPVQTREINGNSNFMSQNDVVAHFGLGNNVGSIYRIEVYWPASDITQVFQGVSANTHMTIHEPRPGDCDEDHDVDLADFLWFVGCFSLTPVDPQCDCADFNDDDAVDLNDFLIFVSAFTS